ncbi:MAG: DUF4197 domain-containing protein [Pseudomonadota bacterium]
MTRVMDKRLDRRAITLGGGAGLVALATSGCASLPGFSLTEAVRRLLLLSSESAFARLTVPDGFWDEQVARLGLGTLLGTRGDVLGRVLTSTLFKNRLEDAFADIAIDASFRAAPIVTDAVRVIGLANAAELVRGGPQAATQALRGELGGRLIDAMVPELDEAIRVASDPLVAQLLNAATGTDVSGIARRLAGNVDEAIWDQIGQSEAEIRANPKATRDPLLIGVFGAQSL